MTKLQAVRAFGETLAEGKITIARDRYDMGNWGMDIDNDMPRLKVPKDFNYRDDDDKAFRKDFITRCPIAKGFADVTLTILHEFGHWYSRSAMDIEVYEKIKKNMDDYFSNPYEVLATQWAICWLLCPVNRKIAKAFERDFFGY